MSGQHCCESDAMFSDSFHNLLKAQKGQTEVISWLINRKKTILITV